MYESTFYTDPFFWALMSMFGMTGATSLFARHKLRRNTFFVSLVLVLVTAGRGVLVLPFCPQPRFEIGGLNWIVGGAIFMMALIIGAIPVFTVRWWSPPKEGMELRTTGIYGVIRHPIYLCEVMWCAGWAIMFRSTYGLALVPLWWLAFLIHALSEEADLERKLGDEYREYMLKVRGRFLPGLPF